MTDTGTARPAGSAHVEHRRLVASPGGTATPGPEAPPRSRRDWSLQLPGVGELIERLNTTWRLAGPEPTHASARQRLIRPVRAAVARLFRTQETFNSTLVQYVNASAASQDLLRARLEEADAAREEYLERGEALLDELRRYHESLAGRERRMEAAMTALAAEQGELRTTVGVLHSRIRAERPSRQERALPSGPGVNDANTHASHSNASIDPTIAPAPNAHAMADAYVGFEDQFRGSPEQIRERLSSYLPIFAGARDVLDIGCGRGEFLRLLGEHGITARGIDLNEAMVDVCRDAGLDATAADALGYLHAQPDGSLGGLFAAQVVEHLEPGYLTQLLQIAFDKLRPGAPIVLETINPACWFAFFESYVRDITHVRPIHPDTLRFLLVASGFQQLEIQYRAPYPEHEKLQRVAGLPGDSAEALNANVDKLNALLFTYLDYAAIGRKP